MCRPACKDKQGDQGKEQGKGPRGMYLLRGHRLVFRKVSHNLIDRNPI
jgi:hypothetical protein